jgi:hypothetical protein
MSKLAFSFIIVALLGLFFNTYFYTTPTLSPPKKVYAASSFDKDTFICSDVRSSVCSPSSNQGSLTYAILGNDDDVVTLDQNEEWYAMVHFPVSGAASNAKLQLPIKKDGIWGSYGSTLYVTVTRITSDWGETTVTWDNRPGEDTSSRYSSTVETNAIDLPMFEFQSPRTLEFDISNYVNDVANGSIQNYGLYIKAIAPEGSESCGCAHFGIKFDAREASSSNPPVITSSTPTPTPTPGGGGTSTPTPVPGGGGGSTATPTPGSGGTKVNRDPVDRATASPGTGVTGTNPTPTPSVTSITTCTRAISALQVTTTDQYQYESQSLRLPSKPNHTP